MAHTVETVKYTINSWRYKKMADIIVTTDSMRSLAQRLEDLANEYNAIYTNQLYGTCVNDIKKAWLGEDADKVCERLEGFHDDFNALVKVIDQYAEHIRKAAQLYDDTQADLKNRASALTQDRQ